MLGTRMDNQVEGVRGWGVPSETIFEVCCLDIRVRFAYRFLSDVPLTWLAIINCI